MSLSREIAAVLFRAWLNRPLPDGSALGMAELVTASSDKPLERRRLRRQFEAIGDRVVDEFASIIQLEYSRLPDTEVVAAALLAEEVLKAAQLTADDFAGADGDPRQVEERIRKTSAERIGTAYLSDAAERLFDQLLREATNYLVDLVVQLPPFQSAAAQESLRRESVLLERVDEVFRQLPRTPQFLGGSGDRAAAAFEIEYRRALARALDEVELFGLDLPEHRRRYNLNVAYISLALEMKEEGNDDSDEPAPESPDKPVPLEPKAEEGTTAESSHMLDGIPRALITGEAGSGKTTLLQWLAVRACQGGPVGQGKNTVPFFIPLRRSSETPPPAPHDFVGVSTPSLAGVMPSGWVHDILAAGRGLVLIDGVDELPPERRADIRHWLADLVSAFPQSRFIITSRPPAVEEGWLDDHEFRTAELQPMSYSDISAFIDHWHVAAIENPVDADEAAEMEEFAGSLRERVRSEPSVRSLATSPLLCAMLCALHRGRKADLPQGRLEVYRAALDGLIDRRDAERKVVSGLPAQSLSLREKRVLLRDLSYWLLVNGYTDASVEQCTERVRQKLRSMPHIDHSAEEVFRYLLTRSGVLREPVPGRVDFLHRTFQEYLAAAEIIEQDSIGQLIENAASDAWREVTILAAGQARRGQREDLLNGLIERGRQEPKARHRFYLLAVACLDASVELSPERTEELKSILAELIPPNSMTDAIALASAGELAVPALGDSWKGAKARTTAACVRSLGLIGAESSLAHLERIAPDKRMTVGREIVRMWDEFDQEEYARRVLSKSPMFNRRWLEMPPEKAQFASHLRGLEGLKVSGLVRGKPSASLSLGLLSGCSSLCALVLEEMPEELDLSPLGDLPKLTDLSLRRCEHLSHPEVIGDLRLDTLELTVLEFRNLRFLARLEELETLRLSAIKTRTDLSEIASLANLRKLEIRYGEFIEDFSPLGGLGLKRLALLGVPLPDSWSWLSSQRDLVSLTIEARLDDYAPILALASLKTLEVLPADRLIEFRSSSTSELERLSLRGAIDLVDIAGITQCPTLESLDLEGAVRLSDLTPLRGTPKLKQLSLTGTAVSDISSLADLPELRRVDLRRTAVRDFSPLAALPELEYLIVDWTRIDAVRAQIPQDSVRVTAHARATPWAEGIRVHFPPLQQLYA